MTYKGWRKVKLMLKNVDISETLNRMVQGTFLGVSVYVVLQRTNVNLKEHPSVI
jgi:hypothetical protein